MPSFPCLNLINNIDKSSHLVWLVLLGCLLGVSVPVQATSLDEIQTLNDSGSSWLALRLLDRYQPDLETDQQAWMTWERYRLAVYQKLDQWSLLSERLQTALPRLPDEFAQWLILESVRTQLQLNHGQIARQLLFSLLWQHHGALDVNEEQLARQYLVKSYLMDNQAKDAFTAQKALHSEFGSQDGAQSITDWKLIQVQIYLLNEKLAQASVMLTELAMGQEHPLQLLISLRNYRMAPQAVLAICRNLLANEYPDKRLPAMYLAVMAEAASMLGDRVVEVDSLERGLAIRDYDQGLAQVFDVHVDRLWDVYAQMKTDLIAQLGHSPSNDMAWLQAAAALENTKPHVARSIYGYLSDKGHLLHTRYVAHQHLAENLLASETSGELLSRLYLKSRRFPQIQTIPAAVRHILIGQAINRTDTPLASRLMQGLQQAPEGINPMDWQLRRARVHIMAGKPQHGTEVILAMLKDISSFSEEQLDKLVQVLFDLQAVGQHKTVIPLFEIVMNRSGKSQRKREMLYWIAESMGEQKSYDEAARYYLKSAILLNLNAMDMWAQSARFKAAEMLTMAGLHADARGIYQGLLDVTQDPGRRAFLEKEIQQLLYRQH